MLRCALVQCPLSGTEGVGLGKLHEKFDALQFPGCCNLLAHLPLTILWPTSSKSYKTLSMAGYHSRLDHK